MFRFSKRPQYQVSMFEVTVVCTECAGHGYVPTPDLNIETCPKCDGHKTMDYRPRVFINGVDDE